MQKRAKKAETEHKASWLFQSYFLVSLKVRGCLYDAGSGKLNPF
jgi:hypothetical protein